mmetsp:Transcript_25617/g.31228  ORF Transcript_25617/g.31228 Transcript_25617/m.31228 type:complete len:106 (+) Transcript_25617:211-528(+)
MRSVRGMTDWRILTAASSMNASTWHQATPHGRHGCHRHAAGHGAGRHAGAHCLGRREASMVATTEAARERHMAVIWGRMGAMSSMVTRTVHRVRRTVGTVHIASR